MTRNRFVAGFSLIELMISMALGLVITAAVGAVFFSSKRAYGSTETLSRMQENARFGLQFVSRELELAGYSRMHEDQDSPSVIYTPSGVFGSGVVLVGTDNASGGGVKTGTDFINLRYSGNPAGESRKLTDCVGNEVPADTFRAIRLFVNTDSELICEVDGTQHPLIDNVASMQLTYGLDTSAVDDDSADEYRAAGAVTDWTRVVSVRVVLGLTGTGDITQREFSAVVALRNRMR